MAQEASVVGGLVGDFGSHLVYHVAEPEVSVELRVAAGLRLYADQNQRDRRDTSPLPDHVHQITLVVGDT